MIRLSDISRYRPKYSGVGSRDTPEDVLSIFKRLGERLCLMGWVGQSGEADGADLAFHNGARRAANYQSIGFGAYIPWNGFRSGPNSPRVFENPNDGIFDMSHSDNWEDAKAIALKARGSFNGLKVGGIALHTRNAYQVLSPSLADPVQKLFCWAEPIGTKGLVSGGTNTAVQLAIRHGIPIHNLYHEEMKDRILQFLDTPFPQG